MKNLLRTFGIIVAAVAVGLSSVSVVFASIGGRPANPDPDNPRSQSIFIYTLKAGETKQDQIYLSNNGTTTDTVLLYAVDGTITNTGAFTCKQDAEERTDMGKAIKLAKSEVTVPGGGNTLVDFSVTLPKNSDIGEHDGCIVIQKKDDPGQQNGSVIVHTRTAVRVAVIVPGDIHRQVSIDKLEVGQLIQDGPSSSHLASTISPSGKMIVRFGLKNEGNVSADVDARLSVKDMFGNEVVKNGGQYAVMSDSTFGVNYNTDYQSFFGGWYKVKVSITYDKHAGTFGVTNNANLLRAESPEVTVFVWPSVAFLMILAALFVAVIGFIIWRRWQVKSAPKRARTKALKQPAGKTMWGAHEVKEGDTLDDLARKHDVSALKVAALNKIQAPYELKPGQKIYLPRKK